jgi:NAD(P)-dependent dehydrogenase (short-subunit alcohol dehydrogenase family)
MTDELRFDGKVTVVTGAGGGIGRAHARLLAAKGARVVVCDLGCATDGEGADAGPADAVAREIAALGGEAVANHASVADPEGAASIVQTALDAYGRLDVVVNNAGIFAPAPFAELTLEQFRAMMEVHYFGTLMVTKAAWAYLVASGAGRIVNTTSEALLGIAMLSSYGAAKAAIFALTRALAVEGAPHGIKANCIAPQAGTRMATAFGNAMGIPPEHLADGAERMPPEMNAPVAAFLAHESCPITGEVLHVALGCVSRLVVVQTRGFARDSITAEDIAANLGVIIDPTRATVAAGSGMGGRPAAS